MKMTKRQIANLVIDILCAALCVVLLFVAITVLTSSGKGYTPFFGRITMGVETDSMWPYDNDGNARNGTRPYLKNNAQGYLPSFNIGALVIADELDEKEKLDLKVGDIVTFWADLDKNGTLELNTHRIVSIEGLNYETNKFIITRGDRAIEGSSKEFEQVYLSAVVGKVISVKEGAGGFARFVKSSAGFFVCIVLPSILIVGYFLVMLIVALSKRDKVDIQAQKQELEDKLRAELEAKLRAEMGLNSKEKEETPPDQKSE